MTQINFHKISTWSCHLCNWGTEEEKKKNRILCCELIVGCHWIYSNPSRFKQMDSSNSTVSKPNAQRVTSDLLTSSRPTSLHEKPRKTVKIGRVEMPRFCANLIFSFFAVAGAVGQNVSLPLWTDSTKENENLSGRSVDCYFVLSFASLSFVVIFGLGTLFIQIFSPQDIGETEKRFPHLLLFLVGFCDSLNGSMVVFASKGSRTPPYLQAILGNFGIPLTILFRWVISLFYSTSKKSENAALFLQLGVPYTLIRHENGAFSKTIFKQEKFENAGFSLSFGQRTFWNKAFRKRWRHDYHVIFLTEFSSTTNPK